MPADLKGALTKAKNTVTGRRARVDSRKPLVTGDYYDRCAVTDGTPIRKGRAQYLAARG